MHKRLLLCDDESFILNAAEFKLKRAGFEVKTGFDGQNGWEIMQTWKPDLVVTDYQMPRLDGIGLCERIRGEEQYQNLPIIMLTAKGFELPHTELAEKWNVLRVLPKPFSPRELLRLIEETFEKQEATAVSV